MKYRFRIILLVLLSIILLLLFPIGMKPDLNFSFSSHSKEALLEKLFKSRSRPIYNNVHEEIMTEYKMKAKIAAENEQINYNLEDARAAYLKKHGREPPPQYDTWFKFAEQNQCFVDKCTGNILTR